MFSFRLTIRGKQNKLKFTETLHFTADQYDQFVLIARDHVHRQLESKPNVSRHYQLPDGELQWFIRTKKRESVSDFSVLSHHNFHALCSNALNGYAEQDRIDVSCCLKSLDRETAPKASVRTVPTLTHSRPTTQLPQHGQPVPHHLQDSSSILAHGLPELPSSGLPPPQIGQPSAYNYGSFEFVAIHRNLVPALREMLAGMENAQVSMGRDDHSVHTV
ncbi:hypothetical protein J8273_5867 [Carpediemonas membranifera]|uniref:Uncharacterized protein n=1 Tax=Carpediemonas membranifera TaxID=201153 RepID=A0A8J6AS72_9EUKA|nr:hypothetical protein J8273_5867 [Carpediemonas membranifera]|eukprot:KAG9392728.1 hypothetical protein J8273_5867 [Carpediemonas membranifera]